MVRGERCQGFSAGCHGDLNPDKWQKIDTWICDIHSRVTLSELIRAENYWNLQIASSVFFFLVDTMCVFYCRPPYRPVISKSKTPAVIIFDVMHHLIKMPADVL